MAEYIPKIVQVAQSQIGYLEKASNADLDDFKANAGNANYTKYGAWYGLNGQPWCDIFVSWCANEAGEQEAVGKFAYVPYHWEFFESKGESHGLDYKPVPGDIVFFTGLSHTGIVTDCANGLVYTVEGNTNGSDFESEGNGVWAKTYSVSSSYLYGYGHPNYLNKPKNMSAIYASIASRKAGRNGIIHGIRLPKHR